MKEGTKEEEGKEEYGDVDGDDNCDGEREKIPMDGESALVLGCTDEEGEKSVGWIENDFTGFVAKGCDSEGDNERGRDSITGAGFCVDSSRVGDSVFTGEFNEGDATEGGEERATIEGDPTVTEAVGDGVSTIWVFEGLVGCEEGFFEESSVVGRNVRSCVGNEEETSKEGDEVVGEIDSTGLVAIGGDCEGENDTVTGAELDPDSSKEGDIVVTVVGLAVDSLLVPDTVGCSDID